MSKQTVIKVENLSKQYRLGNIGTGTISHDINRFFAKMRGKEDPFLKIGETNDRTKSGNSDFVWALRNINFEVQQGEILGIIGKNGAGKSTLLKILSKVTGPTTGSIKAKGRIASLLEVGTGFHPELTGRENVFLNGAILGMTKLEIKSKLDEIVDFAGIERYLDTPVKRYSSGMMVRLGFAVAAHLEPEILVVDEVLAVGDAEFQKKAIGKMKDVSENSGRTVLFVSHNMTSIQHLCNKAIVMQNGSVTFHGDVSLAIEKYLASNLSLEKLPIHERDDIVCLSGFKINDIYISNINNEKIQNNILSGDTLKFIIKYESSENYSDTRIRITINKSNGDIISILNSYHNGKIFSISKGKGQFECITSKFPFSKGILGVSVRVHSPGNIIFEGDNLVELNVESGDFYESGKITPTKELFLIEHDWIQKT